MRTWAPIAMLLAEAVLSAQSSPKDATSPEVRTSQQLARQLELPARRGQAVDGLLRIGAPAVPALLAQARHPDLAIARVALQVLAALEHEGLAAVPELEQLAAGEGERAQAAAWALARLPRRGTFLVAVADEGVVREFDDTGVEIWKREKVGDVWTASLLANGNLLVAGQDFGAREYDAESNIVWQSEQRTACGAERLVDGNTLVICAGANGLTEVDAGNKEVWSHANVPVLFATRLPGGTTLMSDRETHRVFEVARDGQVTWERGDFVLPFLCRRVRDGTTLVLQNTRPALVVDRSGKQVREIPVEMSVSDLVLLPDGTIECGKGYVRRCDSKGTERWRVPIKGFPGRITLR
jgi:hypothetical protein